MKQSVRTGNRTSRVTNHAITNIVKHVFIKIVHFINLNSFPLCKMISAGSCNSNTTMPTNTIPVLHERTSRLCDGCKVTVHSHGSKVANKTMSDPIESEIYRVKQSHMYTQHIYTVYHITKLDHGGNVILIMPFQKCLSECLVKVPSQMHHIQQFDIRNTTIKSHLIGPSPEKRAPIV